MSSLKIMSTLAGVIATASVSAQQPVDGGERGDWAIGLGAAAIIGPAFPGSADTDIMPVPFIDIAYKDRYFLNVPQGLGVYLSRDDARGGWGHTLGVAIAPEFEDREREDAPNLPEVDMTATARVFGGLAYGDFSLNATLAQDLLGNGHDGYWLDLDLEWSQRVGRKGFVSLGPQARLVGGDYADSFYSITPAVAGTSGLPAFDASGGIMSVGGRLRAGWRVTDHWEIFSLITYEHLVGDARDSPITVDDEQLSSVLALVYRF